MLLIVWPRLNLIWIILNSLIFVPIKIVCFYRSPRFSIIWLEISLIIMNDDLLIFQLRIGKLLLMLAAVKRSSWMLRKTSGLVLLVTYVWHLLLLMLVLVLVWRKTHVNIHQVLWSGLFHLSFCKLLLLLIYSHFLLQLLLLLMILLLRRL